MWPFCLSAIRSGFRSRAILLILLLGVALLGVAYLAASFSPRQPKTVTLDVGLSGIRISLILLALFWTQELVAREVERRTVFYAFAYPVSRSSYLLGRYLGVASLLVIAAAMLGILLWGVTSISGGEYQQGFGPSLGVPYFVTVVGLWLDACVVAAFGLWIASLSTVTMLPVVLGGLFAIGAKGLGAALDYLDKGADGDSAFVERLGPVVNVVRHILPDLSRLDFRVWTMYGIPPADQAISFAAILALSYIGLLIALAVMGFARREFF